MKRLVETTEEGFEQFFGKKITLFCLNYIYTGVVSAVDDFEVELTDAKIVYETGELASGCWKDAQSLPSPWYVRLYSIESWGPAKC